MDSRFRTSPSEGCRNSFFPDIYVRDLLRGQESEWNIPLLNQLMEPSDVLMIRGLPLRPSSKKDRALWHYSKQGDYTVKSGYDLIRTKKREIAKQAVLEPSFTALKAHVWTVDCPSKIQHFMWQVLNGALAVLTGLRQRRVVTDVLCKGCGTEAETINHVLFECAEAKATWNLLQFSQTDLSFPASSIYVNMDLLFSRHYSWKNMSGDTMTTKDIYPWILWYLWKSRNKRTFQGIGWSPLEIIQLAEKELRTWQLAHVGTQPMPISSLEISFDSGSILPPNRCLVDGSWKKEDSTSGLGWICYSDNRPIIMGNRGTRRSLSALHSEFEALLWAMQEILHRGIHCTIFLTDCTDLQKITKDPAAWPAFDVYWDMFVDLRGRFSTFSLAHIKRESNRQADALARHARDRSVEFSIVDMFPPRDMSFPLLI